MVVFARRCGLPTEHSVRDVEVADDGTFVQILGWLAGQQDLLCERVQDGTVDSDVYDVAIRHPQLDERLIAKMGDYGASSDIDHRRPRTSIWLSPVTRGDLAIPMLSPHWDFRSEQKSVALYLGLYFRDTKWDHVDGVGYRFEYPHQSGEGKIGQHDYFHAQPISDFAEGVNQALPVQERTQPVSTPAFPLEAHTTAQLLVCLLISLYGGSFSVNLAQSGIDGIHTVLSDLRCCSKSTS